MLYDENVIEVENLVKKFGSFVAVNNLTLPLGKVKYLVF